MTSSRNSDIARRIPDLRPRTGEPWTPPLSGQRLEHLLARFREWDPIDWAAVFEDLNLALEDHGPEENEVEELVERLRGILMRLARIALGGNADVTDPRAAQLIERARALRSEELPGDRWKTVGHVRRLGWVTSELLEHLAKTGHVMDAA